MIPRQTQQSLDHAARHAITLVYAISDYAATASHFDSWKQLGGNDQAIRKAESEFLLIEAELHWYREMVDVGDVQKVKEFLGKQSQVVSRDYRNYIEKEMQCMVGREKPDGKVDTKELLIEVKLRVFLPCQILAQGPEFFAPRTIDNLTTSTPYVAVFSGDDRSFSYDQGSARADVVAVVGLTDDVVPQNHPAEKNNRWGTTNGYDIFDCRHVPGRTHTGDTA